MLNMYFKVVLVYRLWHYLKIISLCETFNNHIVNNTDIIQMIFFLLMQLYFNIVSIILHNNISEFSQTTYHLCPPFLYNAGKIVIIIISSPLWYLWSDCFRSLVIKELRLCIIFHQGSWNLRASCFLACRVTWNKNSALGHRDGICR